MWHVTPNEMRLREGRTSSVPEQHSEDDEEEDVEQEGKVGREQRQGEDVIDEESCDRMSLFFSSLSLSLSLWSLSLSLSLVFFLAFAQ